MLEVVDGAQLVARGAEDHIHAAIDRIDRGRRLREYHVIVAVVIDILTCHRKTALVADDVRAPRHIHRIDRIHIRPGPAEDHIDIVLVAVGVIGPLGVG